MSRSAVEPLVVGRVIGEVVDMFRPAAELSVQYGTRHVANGCHIKPSEASDPPLVLIQSSSGSQSIIGNLYTLVMTDPDAPSPSEPTMREWLHWIVVDIPGGSDATKGSEVVPYMGPRPPTGIHRYAFIVFKQSGGLPLRHHIHPPSSRANFSTRGFAAQYGLGTPAAAAYFNSQKESAAARRNRAT